MRSWSKLSRFLENFYYRLKLNLFKFQLSISIHSYGNWWLTPFGNSYSVRPANYADLLAKGKVGLEAIRKYKSMNHENF